MKAGKRRHWTVEKKLKIIEEARQTGLKVSEVYHLYQTSPAQFYTWEKRALKAAPEALGGNRAGRKQKGDGLQEAADRGHGTRLRIHIGTVQEAARRSNGTGWFPTIPATTGR